MFKVMAKKAITFFVIKYPLPKHAGLIIIWFLLDCTRSLGFATQNPRCFELANFVCLGTHYRSALCFAKLPPLRVFALWVIC